MATTLLYHSLNSCVFSFLSEKRLKIRSIYMDLLFGSAIFTSMWLYITSNIVCLTCLVSFSEEKKSYTDFSFRE